MHLKPYFLAERKFTQRIILSLYKKIFNLLMMNYGIGSYSLSLNNLGTFRKTCNDIIRFWNENFRMGFLGTAHGSAYKSKTIMKS